jgi:catechol 2,3-dioxygenase
MSNDADPSQLPIHPQTRIGHVHLKVSDLQRAVDFYTGVLGFQVMHRSDDAAFLSAGGYHHHIGLNTWFSKGGDPAPVSSPGLYHVAILLPNRLELARAYERLLRHAIPIRLAEDHGVSEAIYFADPDGNGIEIYRDRDKSEWPRTESGDFTMISEELDLTDLLAELERHS